VSYTQFLQADIVSPHSVGGLGRTSGWSSQSETPFTDDSTSSQKVVHIRDDEEVSSPSKKKKKKTSEKGKASQSQKGRSDPNKL